MLATLLALQIVMRLTASNIDYYEMLGVDRNANEQEIRRAFKRLALTMHPDKRKGDPEAHKKFVEISEAYDVLKDPGKRKLYDQHGKEGIKDFNNPFWDSETYVFDFNLFHHNPKITVLTDFTFDALVSKRGTRWIIYFFSPLCSHCHEHGPLWLKIANELDSLLRVAAVNCFEYKLLCQRLDIQRFPMIKIYPENKYFLGETTFSQVTDFVDQFLEKDVVKLSYEKLLDDQAGSSYEKRQKGAIVAFCSQDHQCLDTGSLQKLSNLLQPMAFVAEANCNEDMELCRYLKFSSGVVFYPNGFHKLNEAFSLSKTSRAMEAADEIIRMATSSLEISEQDLSLLLDRNPVEQPIAIIFENEAKQAAETVRMKAMMIFENIRYKWINCRKSPKVCGKVNIEKYPSVIICKPIGGYEIYHGKLTAENVVSFVKSSFDINLIDLREEDLKLLNVASESWLIIFSAHWCPPCTLMVPQLHQALKGFGNRLRVGSFDCETYKSHCNQLNVRHLPTLVLYNETKPFSISGYMDADKIIDFLTDIMSPIILQITERFLIRNVLKAKDSIIWLIAYIWTEDRDLNFLLEYRKLARSVKHLTRMKVALVHCAFHKALCDRRDIRTYPTIHLHLPTNRPEYHVFLNPDMNSRALFAWLNIAASPDMSRTLTESNFKKMVTNGHAWLVYFYSPWARECLDFEPEFKQAVQELEPYGLSIGKVNCPEEAVLCAQLSVNEHPTLLLYPPNFSAGRAEEIPVGAAIRERNGILIANRVINLLRRRRYWTNEL